MDDILNQLTQLVSTWEQAGTLAGLVVLVNLLTNLTKIKWLQDRVPAAARPWIAAVLGTAGGVLTALVGGKPLPLALVSGLLIGMSAIGTHELVSTARPKVRAARKAAKAAMKAAGPTATIVLIVSVGLIGIDALNSGCSAVSKETKSIIANNMADCGKPAVKSVIDAAIDLALSYVEKLVDQDGAVDWNTFADKTKQSGWDGGICLYQATVDKFLMARMKAGPSPTPTMDPDLQKERAMDARAKAWPGLGTVSQ